MEMRCVCYCVCVSAGLMGSELPSNVVSTVGKFEYCTRFDMMNHLVQKLTSLLLFRLLTAGAAIKYHIILQYYSFEMFFVILSSAHRSVLV